jgi:hypothetical protein
MLLVDLTLRHGGQDAIGRVIHGGAFDGNGQDLGRPADLHHREDNLLASCLEVISDAPTRYVSPGLPVAGGRRRLGAERHAGRRVHGGASHAAEPGVRMGDLRGCERECRGECGVPGGEGSGVARGAAGGAHRPGEGPAQGVGVHRAGRLCWQRPKRAAGDGVRVPSRDVRSGRRERRERAHRAGADSQRAAALPRRAHAARRSAADYQGQSWRRLAHDITWPDVRSPPPR